jgi:hypothetical protein
MEKCQAIEFNILSFKKADYIDRKKWNLGDKFKFSDVTLSFNFLGNIIICIHM